MQIYLYQNEQQIGPYSESIIKEMVAAGTFCETDICWHEGLADWQPLNTVISFAETAAPPAKRAPRPPELHQTVIQTNVKQGAIIGGWVCFALGVGLMFLTMWSFFIYGPLYLVAFILSIVAMSQRRVLGGILLLLATLIVPTILGFYLFASRTTEALTRNTPAEPVAHQNTHGNGPISSPTPESKSAVPDVALVATPPAGDKPIENTPAEPRRSKHPELDAKMGFRNYKLGTPITAFNANDIEAGEAFIKTDMKPFFAKNFDSKLGAAEIDSIQLNFNEDLLESVGVKVNGEQNSVALRETLIAAYGPPDETSDFVTKTLTWRGDNCVLSLDSQLTGDAIARFSSKSVDDKIKGLKLEKAKEGAAAGAGSL